MAISDRRHDNISKQTTLLADIDVALSIGVMYGQMISQRLYREMNYTKTDPFIEGDCNEIVNIVR